MQKRYFFLLFLAILGTSVACAQSKKFSAYATAGPLVQVLDSGVGFHVGVQPYYALWRYVGIEGLANYSYTKIKGSFIAGQTGKETNVNLLLGARVYFMPPEKRNRLFFNVLFGQGYTTEVLNGTKKTPSWESAGSFGLYYQPGRFLIGAGGESQGYFFLRLGVNLL